MPLPPSAPSDDLPTVIVQAPEPQFVAPTSRDKIGRVWAPVSINGIGRFRFVLDTGASGSAITAQAAAMLALRVDPTHTVLLRGVTGTSVVPTVHVDSLAVGDVILAPATLPVVADALGGTDGILGTEHFANKRIDIDFRHDSILITNSRGTRARLGFVSLPLERAYPGLLAIRASVAGVAVLALLDTGGQYTIGNEAMRAAILRRRARGVSARVIDVTAEEQLGETIASPTIRLGSIDIANPHITYGDMRIFEHLHLTHQPAVLLGMDVIGILDTFIIDYRRREVQIRLRNGT
jgi:predicted aspartyl protease